ncbi:hypothetical protein [Roseomonas chloroacetimidivorans]|uniref:hypothetical protein n=1 Tax=Roseomonas chloroacetimidivorans TaxID=1766656 RepID=UPI003C769CC3
MDFRKRQIGADFFRIVPHIALAQGARVGGLSTNPSLLPELTRHETRVDKHEGPHGGPSFSYCDALIRSNRKGALYSLEGGLKL